MKNYFEGCFTLDALKARYRIMAKELHRICIRNWAMNP